MKPRQKIFLEIKEFYSGEDLLDDIEEFISYDLILLDIELAKINGVETGHRLRENDKKCQIIYVSSKTEYAMELFQIRPFNFLVKPIEETVLFNCLEEYVSCFYKETYFEYKNKKAIKLIPVNEIIYFESMKRKVIVHCIDEKTYEYYGKLEELFSNKCLNMFVTIHQSFFVNIFHIDFYSYDEVTVTGGQILTVSKPNRKEIRRAILQHRAGDFKTR
ncbi:MAG: LytTR family DNA-binding domain-containing protein [Clostridium sp.]|nr:LytTR family DNA-binding domain-containing protein [Clostridium sp.]